MNSDKSINENAFSMKKKIDPFLILAYGIGVYIIQPFLIKFQAITFQLIFAIILFITIISISIIYKKQHKMRWININKFDVLFSLFFYPIIGIISFLLITTYKNNISWFHGDIKTVLFNAVALLKKGFFCNTDLFLLIAGVVLFCILSSLNVIIIDDVKFSESCKNGNAENG